MRHTEQERAGEQEGREKPWLAARLKLTLASKDEQVENNRVVRNKAA